MLLFNKAIVSRKDELFLHCSIVMDFLKEHYSPDKYFGAELVYVALEEIIEDIKDGKDARNNINWYAICRPLADEGPRIVCDKVFKEIKIIEGLISEVFT